MVSYWEDRLFLTPLHDLHKGNRVAARVVGTREQAEAAIELQWQGGGWYSPFSLLPEIILVKIGT